MILGGVECRRVSNWITACVDEASTTLQLRVPANDNAIYYLASIFPGTAYR